MIGRLAGKVIDRAASSVIVDCGGVGYEVTASQHTLSTVGPVGTAIDWRIYTHFTDSRISLYGFSSAEERALFDLLITVKNVGPSSAIKILSAGAGPIEIAKMICGGDLKALNQIKGVGKRTAELLIVELRDRCEGLLTSWGAQGNVIALPKSVEPGLTEVVIDEVTHALLQLGWKPSEVEKVTAKLPIGSGQPMEVLLKEALRAMPR